MNFEQFPKNPIEKRPEETFQEKLKKIISFENGILDRFRSGKIGKIAITLSLMTAFATISVEKTYALEKSGGDSKKIESSGGEPLESDFFDLSGKKSEGGGRSFVVGEGRPLDELKTNPAEKVIFGGDKIEDVENHENFTEEDENGNIQKRSIGEIR